VEVGGEVSQPLLMGLFDPASSTHDGAVLVDGGKIERFGVQLPLSSRLAPISDRGTRHAAALGLSEACDALVIVVSEERGTISVAEGGDFQTLSAVGELKRRLDAFNEKITSGDQQPELGWWKRRRIQNILLAAVLSIALWLVFAYRTGTVYRTYTVPIELRNLPDTLSLQEPVPAEATVTLAGSEHGFRILEKDNLLISFDLSDIDSGLTELTIQDKRLNLPGDLKLYRVNPEQIWVRARAAEKTTGEEDGE
jgi:hypothetical protein